MRNILKKKAILPILILVVIILGSIAFNGCNNAGNANSIKEPTPEVPIAGTQEQQALFRATFATELGRDSVWVNAFEKAFTSVFGADSLKQFLEQETLPHIAINGNQEIKGTERGEFALNAGATLTVSGIVYGRVLITKGARLVNKGVIYGNIENAYGEFEDTGFHQGALISR